MNGLKVIADPRKITLQFIIEIGIQIREMFYDSLSDIPDEIGILEISNNFNIGVNLA